jgi:diketogulonate reductase-like aldo/keto reductase
MWLALKQAQEKGIVRDIGVSNYGIQHIDEIASIDSKASLPAVNQIEVCRTRNPSRDRTNRSN